MKHWIFVILLLPSVAFADEFEFTRAHAGKSYQAVRAELIAEGWQPDPVDSFCEDIVKRELQPCDEYPELVRCAPTGVFPCIMQWSRDGVRIEIHTAGEDPRIVKDQ